MFIEKPTSPYEQRATWSDYKEHNTIKWELHLQGTSAFCPTFGQVAHVIDELHKKVAW